MNSKWISEVHLMSFPLKAAYLCANCDAVGNCINKCVACGTEHLLSIAKILNPPEPEMQQPHRDSGLPSLQEISDWKKLRD